MEKTTINVPKGIRYISEWKEFKLPDVPTIINKQICGCGFTEYCLSNSDSVILVSPRKVLLENKASQHKEDLRLLYVRNDGEKLLDYEKDLNKNKELKKEKIEIKEESKEKILILHQAIQDHFTRIPLTQGCKFSVTYDSFRHIKEVLGDSINLFYIVVDEMQSVFIDAKFKPTTGIELLNQLKGLSKVCFVSATPMLDKYLEMMDEFKDLNYINLDWGIEDPLRITKPQLEVHYYNSLQKEVTKIIDKYKNSNFEIYSYKDSSGKIQEIISNEAVFYVNSVKSICEIIKRNRLTLENTNIICANTEANKKKLRTAFGIKKKDIEYEHGGIGHVPEKGELHKMFTLCTRTVYLGADFYSTCAQTFIFSDANVDSLSVDISMDLPQILGRQRLNENPWKNRAILFCKIIGNKKRLEEKDFLERLKEKKERTESLLESYSTSPTTKTKNDLAENYRKIAKTFNYSDDYVSVNEHTGGILIPEFNNLILISEIRCYEIQQIDYKDRVSLFSSININLDSNVLEDDIDNLITSFNSLSTFKDKMKFICELNIEKYNISDILEKVPITYKSYYNTLGPKKCKAMMYQLGYIKKEYEKQIMEQEDKLVNEIYSIFKVGNRYTKMFIKEELKKIYKKFNKLDIIPKATDLLKWFYLSDCKILNKETGKRDMGFEILKKIID